MKPRLVEVPGWFGSDRLVGGPLPSPPSFVKSTKEGRQALSLGERET
jgi:hypothetical protein